MDEDTIVSISIIIAILAISAGLINTWLGSTGEKRVLSLYILNERGNADPRFYPGNVTAGEPFLLYVVVQNDGEEALSLRVDVKVGDLSTPPPSRASPSPLPTIWTLEFTVPPRGQRTSQLELTLNETGLDRRVIFELYILNTSGSYRYTGIWNQLWVNVTAPP